MEVFWLLIDFFQQNPMSMKWLSTVLLIGVVCLNPHQLFSQIDESGNSYYVVIGAYGQEKNAKDFMNWAKAAGLNPKCEQKITKNLYYVYTMKSDNWGIPVQEAERIRSKYPDLDDTWVYHGIMAANSEMIDSKINKTNTAVAIVEPESAPEIPVEEDNSKKFFFKLTDEEGVPLKAPVEVVDLDNSKLQALFPSNENVSIKPVNETGRIMVQSKIFGYKLSQIGIDFNSPTDSAGIMLDSGRYIVPMVLQELVRGDIAIMYNVFFFKDAAIMRPDSKYEVNALVTMMKEFPNRKIVIHGHTNGSLRGKILTMSEKKNFFSLTGCKTGSGSAVALSKERALCIEEFLISNGISEDRMSIKPWGGKKPLVHPDHERAIDNVRVEVEIITD
jgi:outer membrane protein OmpA-like peptidoglycan-associated protein